MNFSDLCLGGDVFEESSVEISLSGSLRRLEDVAKRKTFNFGTFWWQNKIRVHEVVMGPFLGMCLNWMENPPTEKVPSSPCGTSSRPEEVSQNEVDITAEDVEEP